MREIAIHDRASLRDYYRHFARVEAADVSSLYYDWALAVAEDDEVIEALLQLPEGKRQANLLFAAMRVQGIELRPWDQIRDETLQQWEAIRDTILTRRAQTNEAGRIAVLNMAFSYIQQQTHRPLALIEVGASAGLCLYPDAWPIRYKREGHDDVVLTPRGPLTARAELSCSLSGDVAAPAELPDIAWRAGIDLNPLDLTSQEDRQWLQALVWPGMEYRLERIKAGAELVQQDPPRLAGGDLNQMLPELLGQVPAGAVPVVFHSAVLVYVSAQQRALFHEQVRGSGAYWVSNEGLAIFSEIQEKLPAEDPERSGFILALDGEPLARTGPHGQYLEALQSSRG